MTNTIKYSLAALFVLMLLFLYNRNTQESLKLSGESIFEGDPQDIFRVLLTENDKSIELVKLDSTWSITNNDSLKIRESQVEKIFDRLLKVKKNQ